MSIEIFYFSGTGNSLVVARDIAGKTGARLTPMASVMSKPHITSEADAIGIVFPVYYMELPMIVEEFARRLEGIAGKYIFAVCTYGGAAGASLRDLKRIIRLRGGTLAAAYGVSMPQNSFHKPYEKSEQKYATWQKRLDLVVRNTLAKAGGTFYANMWLELIIMPFHPLFIRPTCVKHFQKTSHLPAGHTYEEYKHAYDHGFSTNSSCTGCGLCAKVCPLGNIAIIDGKPTWQGKCEHCLACYNWCPSRAIAGGITKGFYYRHPQVTIAEAMEQQKGS